MSFSPLSAEDLARADELRQATRKKGSAKTARDANIQMAIHGASEVLVKGAPGLFSQRRPSTIEAYEGAEDLPEARHMTAAVANLSNDIAYDVIKEDAPRSMMRWLVSDVLTQAQALRISIGAAHPEVIHCLEGDERLTAEIALENEALRANLDTQKTGNYGAMEEGDQDAIRMDIESGLHITGPMQTEIDRQGLVMDRLGFVQMNPGQRLHELGSIYHDEEQQTAAIVANYQYANITTGNPALDKAIRATSDFVAVQDGQDTLVKYGIEAAQTMVAHNYDACQSMDENQMSHRIISMYELVKDAAQQQRQGGGIVLIRGASESQNMMDTFGVTTYEFGSMSPRGRDALNNIIESGSSLSTAQKMGVGLRLQSIDDAREASRNLPAVAKKTVAAKRTPNLDKDSVRKIREPASKKQRAGIIGVVRGALDSISR